MINFLEVLRNRFKAKSLKHLFVIFTIFSISGSLTVYLSFPILDFIKYFYQFENSIIQMIIRILIIFPVYQLTLLLVGTLLGELEYFLQFERRFFKKIFSKKNKLLEFDNK